MSEDKIVINIDIDLEDLIPGFLENRQGDLQKLEQALGEEDFETLRSIGHNLKGVGGGYGFHDMTTIGAAIEEGARENKLENRKSAKQVLGRLVDEIEGEIADVENRLSKREAEPVVADQSDDSA